LRAAPRGLRIHARVRDERFARDARLFTIGGGISEIMKEIIAKELRL
jgi:alkylation response protein AidB-like acyl-CoA dehydrogenase